MDLQVEISSEPTWLYGMASATFRRENLYYYEAQMPWPSELELDRDANESYLS